MTLNFVSGVIFHISGGGFVFKYCLVFDAAHLNQLEAIAIKSDTEFITKLFPNSFNSHFKDESSPFCEAR